MCDLDVVHYPGATNKLTQMEQVHFWRRVVCLCSEGAIAGVSTSISSVLQEMSMIYVSKDKHERA
eukprot:1162008-Pelagomonas_calceolata.AAC.8